MLRKLFALLVALPLLGGCVAMAVGDAAIGAAVTAAKVPVKIGGKVVGAAVGGDDEASGEDAK